MNDASGEAGIEFPINQTLLDEATQTKEEWRVVRDRLAKIEEHKSNVSPSVYERVRTDYKARLKVVTDAVLKKKADVDEELGKLHETRSKIVADLEQHRHSLEEIKFRHTLGEYNEEEYQNQARVEQDKISKFETVLSAVNSNIHRYEAIYKDEPGLFAPQEQPAAKEETSEVVETSGFTPARHEAEPMTDEAGYVIEEGGPDYFGVTDAERTNPNVEESATAKGPLGPVEMEAEPGVQRGRIVVINGDDAGAAYPLKGTASFGRAESNTITIRDAKVSRQHAQVQQQGTEYVLVDLNSSNGTYVNGQRIEEHVLSNGDEIRIGDCIMQFQV
ncbi:MAG: FHA domain-containing protein [bacterium]